MYTTIPRPPASCCLLCMLQPTTTGAKAFKRVHDEEWVGKKGSWSNRYEDTFGQGCERAGITAQGGSSSVHSVPCNAMRCNAMQCHLLLPRCTVHHTEAGASRRSRCWEQYAARDSGMKKRRRSGAHTRVAPLTRMRRFHTSLRATKSDASRAVFCAAAVHVPARLPLSGLAWTHLVIIV